MGNNYRKNRTTAPSNLVEAYIPVLNVSKAGIKYYSYKKRLYGTLNFGENRQARRHDSYPPRMSKIPGIR